MFLVDMLTIRTIWLSRTARSVPSISSLIRNDGKRVRLPLRLLWNVAEHRPRAPFRLLGGSVLIFVLAGLGNQYGFRPLGGEGPLVDAANQLVGVAPQAVGIGLGVALASLFIDRRRLTDLGLDLASGWWRGLAGGIALGVSIVAFSVIGALLGGYIAIGGTQLSGGPLVWLLLAGSAVLFQLLFVVPEEWFVRGYVITNITEGFDGVPSVPRSVAAGIGVVVAALVFYVTHSGRGEVFGLMAGGLAVLLGVGYVLSGDLSIPIGIHAGINVASVLVGTNPQSASVLRLTAPDTVVTSLTLPIEVVVLRLLGAALGIAVLLWWYATVRGPLGIASTVAHPTLRWGRLEEESRTEARDVAGDEQTDADR